MYHRDVSLRFAVLATLLDGEMAGYDLARVFDASVANFWHALPQQIYAELKQLEADGLVSARTVIQETRPNKRLFTLTEDGRKSLGEWMSAPPRPGAIKDAMLVRIYAAEAGDTATLLATIETSREQRVARLTRYRKLRAGLLAGRSEDEFLRTAPRVGPYLTLQRGIRFEEETIAWYEWAAAVLRARAADELARE